MVVVCFLNVATMLTAVAAGSPGNSSESGSEYVYLAAGPYPEGVADEAAYVAWMAQRTQVLSEAAERWEDALQRIELRLAAVNWMLAAECEPAMSRYLQRLDTESDRSEVEQLTQRCLAELAAAREAIARHRTDVEADSEAAAKMGSSIDVLAAFAEALRVCVETADAGQFHEDVRQAIRALSPYVESERVDVASAAELWQAVLYRRADRLDRALRLLPFTGEAIRGDAVRYDFFAKLLRCEYVREGGAYSTAWAMLLDLEERAQDWFSSAAARGQAAQSAVWGRVRICAHWPQASSEPDSTAKWCESATERLRATHFGGGSGEGLLRLDYAVPLIVEIRDPGELIPAESPTLGPPSPTEQPPALEPASGQGANDGAQGPSPDNRIPEQPK